MPTKNDEYGGREEFSVPDLQRGNPATEEITPSEFYLRNLGEIDPEIDSDLEDCVTAFEHMRVGSRTHPEEHGYHPQDRTNRWYSPGGASEDPLLS